MNTPALSVLIPARNEQWLARTIQDLLENGSESVEVIAVLDGAWAEPPIPDHPRVHLIHHSVSIGQRAAVNEAARLARGKFVMKCDAHCSFDKGFDVKLLADMQDDWTMVPVMKNLHIFDWVCKKCGDRRYQGPTPTSCPKCDNTTDFEMDVVWIAKPSPQSKSYCFDSTPKFQYFRDFNKRPEGQGDITETMSLQGSCFLMTRKKFFELNVCDESFGSWGSQGIEVAARTWLSGGRVVCNQKTWYAHCFRTQGGSFGFPYALSQSDVDFAKRAVRDLFFNDAWPKQVHPLSWLLEKFAPVPGWGDEDLEKVKKSGEAFMRKRQPRVAQPSKSLVYYTCNVHSPDISEACRKQLELCRNGYETVTVSLNKHVPFGDNVIVMEGKRSPEMMHRQIVRGLEEAWGDIIFLCESDVLYHPSHFEFVPPRKDAFYYNTNVWRVRYEDGFAYRVDFMQQVSGLCAYRELLLEHYRKRIERIERDGWSRATGFEPGTHRLPRGVDDYGASSWESPYPNIDIRHKRTQTPTKWSPSEFRNQKYARGWRESNEVPGWGRTTDILERVKNGRELLPFG